VLGHRQLRVVNQIASQNARKTSTWAVIRANQSSRRRAQAALLVHTDRYLGDLSEYVIERLGEKTAARRVVISARQQRHILERRKIVNTVDADLCARRLGEALQNLRYWKQPQGDPRVYELIGFVPSANRHVLVALKLVSAEYSKSGADEWWVRTAHPYGRKKLRRKLTSGSLQSLRKRN